MTSTNSTSTNSIDLDHGTVSARIVAPGRARIVYAQPANAWGSDSPAAIRDAAQRLLGVELAAPSGEWSRAEGDGEVAQDVEVLGAQEIECAYCGAEQVVNVNGRAIERGAWIDAVRSA